MVVLVAMFMFCRSCSCCLLCVCVHICARMCVVMTCALFFSSAFAGLHVPSVTGARAHVPSQDGAMHAKAMQAALQSADADRPCVPSVSCDFGERERERERERDPN